MSDSKTIAAWKRGTWELSVSERPTGFGFHEKMYHTKTGEYQGERYIFLETKQAAEAARAILSAVEVTK